MSKKNENEKMEKTELVKADFKEKELAPFVQEGHRMPRTRREFLAHGFIGLTATAVVPTLGSMALSSRAFGQDAACEVPTFEGGKLPYMCIDVAGGCNFAGQNVIVGMKNGAETQEDTSFSGYSTSDYIRLGIAPEEHPSLPGKVVDKYGLKMHRTSGMLEGMNSVLDGITMENGRPITDGIDGLVFCTRTSDDTAVNQINTAYMANKAGAKGELVELIGNVASMSGGRSAPPQDQYVPELNPTKVESSQDAAGLLSLGQKLGDDLLNAEKAKVQKFMERIGKLSQSKLEEVSQKNSIDALKQVLNCSFQNAKQLFDSNSAANLSLTGDTLASTAFAGGSERIGAVAKLIIDQKAGAGTVTIGGGDYHQNAVVSTHAKDREVGEAIGRCILLANLKQKNLCLHIFTDGGVAGDAGGLTEPALIAGIGNIPKVKWVGDSGTRSSAVMIFFKHNHDGSSMVREDSNNVPRRQVGNFVKNGGVNQNSIIGNSTVKLWMAIMLNYLAAQGKEGEFDSLFTEGVLNASEKTALLRMKGIFV